MSGKNRKKNALLNTLMVVAIGVIAAVGVLMAGRTQGWFDKGGNGDITATEKKGNVNVYRSGVAYTLRDDAVLRDGDSVETLSLSTLTLRWGENRVVLDENSSLGISRAESGQVTLTLESGKIFAVLKEEGGLYLRGESVELREGAVLLSSGHGNNTVSVLRGQVTLLGQTLREGEYVSLPDNAGDRLDIYQLRLEALDAFALDCVSEAGDGLCFTAADAQTLRERREQERQQALEAKLLEGDEGGEGPICTLAILCTSILDNREDLAAGKEAYLPHDGVILGVTRMRLQEGDTAFDVLERACTAAGIQLEYAWTPIYNSYYVEGIHNLYEFDCGEQSGWMFQVNGWSPNYSSYAYTLSEGDAVVWYYNCKGLAYQRSEAAGS